MTKKRWALIILLILVAFGYYKLFYKTYSTSSVAKSADCIIAIDTKRIINTVLWNIITTPGQWKNISLSFPTKNEIGWTDMFQVPDIAFIFHSKDQPLNVWYTILTIKDKSDFEKGLLQNHFEKINHKSGQDLYYSKDLNIVFLKKENKILAGNISQENLPLIEAVENELFVQKQFTTKDVLDKNIEQRSHISIQVLKNNFTQEILAKANFDKSAIHIDAVAAMNDGFIPAENEFSFSSKSLLTLAFTQPPKNILNLLPDSSKVKISKAINIEIDSMLLPENSYYSLDLPDIKTRVDSAVSFTYDDNFNSVPKTVVNNIQEPSFNFRITGKNILPVVNYLEQNKKIEKTENGYLFTPMPFVKSFCNITDSANVNITSSDYQFNSPDENISCFLFCNFLLDKVPENLLKYLPEEVRKRLQNFESIQVVANGKKSQAILHIIIRKKTTIFPYCNFRN